MNVILPTTGTPPQPDVTGAASQAAADPARPVRVLLADDHPMIRSGVRELIEQQPDMTVVAEARGAEEALASLGGGPDVAIVDYHLGAGRNGLWVTRRLMLSPDAPRVLIYSAFTDSALAVAAIVAGADGLVSKTALGEELCEAIRTLAAGEQYLPEVPRSVADAVRSQLQPDDQPIFGMLLAGLEPEEICDALEISPERLQDRRGAMLAALARAGGPIRDAIAPLDYERSRRRPRYRVA